MKKEAKKRAGAAGGKFGGRSLYGQLLARSLFVLAALLVLIGGLQYFLMRGFLYQNEAESLEAQLRAVPPFLAAEWGGERTGAPQGGDSAENGSLSADGGSAGEEEKESAGSSVQSSDRDPAESNADSEAVSESEQTAERDVYENGGGMPEDSGGGFGVPGRRALLLAGLSLASVAESGRVTDLNADYGLPAPVLSAREYDRLRAEPAQRGGRVHYVLAAGADGAEQLLVVRAAGNFGGGELPMLQIGTATGALRDILWRQLAIFGGLAALALAGGFALYRPVLRRSLSPLSRMVEQVKVIDAGRLDERFPAEQGQAETDRLARSFNGMLERLELAFAAERESQERMRRFIADASHELRTPLTSIHGFLEVLLRGSSISEQQLRAALRSMHGESQRMNKLVEDLLLLVKLDRGPELRLAPLRPAALLRELESHLRMLAGERRVTLSLPAGGGPEVTADPDKLKQIVLNLFGNAVQHTDARQGEIALALERRGEAAVISVRDNGPGIPADMQRRVFERFYRGDESRSRRSGGAGLGLAISQSIAEAHGGSLELASEPGAGSTFRIVLPLR
ncbi:ATP-binding protein [Saccharibacillus sp. CPCC 101409]|uniref:ATP-binding protein n=1 Tax=Saccharibacillus sp. CPCC 101409 TaxID=3058041 RepID=UPI0026720685|nr:ATP-binding protein [Saccharibacillus sp. CPCC 101409]MDO3409416.1 ATP-binding protein [Saccharibacillus sp. CPCC 101409]